MTPRSVFKIIVATVGILGIGYGLLYLIDGLLGTFGLMDSSRNTPKYYALRGIIETIAGYWFMRKAGALADVAFPQHDDESVVDDEENADDDGAEAAEGS